MANQPCVEQLRRDGYLIVPGALAQAQLVRICEAYDRLESPDFTAGYGGNG